MWAGTGDLPKSPGHPFYQRLNQVLAANSFDALVEAACRRFYATKLGRPSRPPGQYFRLMLVVHTEAGRHALGRPQRVESQVNAGNSERSAQPRLEHVLPALARDLGTGAPVPSSPAYGVPPICRVHVDPGLL
jgi:hypothetical protein